MIVPRPEPHFLREILTYFPITGWLQWQHRADVSATWNTRFAGQRALSATDKRDGRRRGTINYYPVMASHVIWAWMTGTWPEQEVDHINGNPADDRWINLRIATRSQQTMNTHKGRRADRSHLPHGVQLYVDRYRRKPYYATIHIAGKSIYLGSFATAVEAQVAYMNAAEELHGKFALHRSRIFT